MRRNVNRDRALFFITYLMLATFVIGYLLGIIHYEGWNPWVLVCMLCLAYCAACFGTWVYKMIPKDVEDEDREINDPTLAFGRYLFDKKE